MNNLIVQVAKYIFLFLAALFCMLPAGCVAEIDSAYAETDPAGWEREQFARAVFVNSDTLSARNIDFFILCNGELFRETRSLEIEITITSPDSLRTTETVLFGLSEMETDAEMLSFILPEKNSNVTERPSEHSGKTGNTLFRHEKTDSRMAEATVYASGIGSTYSGFRQLSEPYMRGAVMSVSGEYVFEFSHSSPAPLKGIRAIGVSIK